MLLATNYKQLAINICLSYLDFDSYRQLFIC